MPSASVSTFARRPGARGFSLIELLIGVAIGMVGLMVIFKTVATWDIHTRSTTSGGEAESTGTLAMFNLERDVKQAGIGIALGATAVLGCPVQGYDAGAGSVPARTLGPFRLAPVVITAGVGGAPDKIDVLASDSAFFVDVATFSASTSSSKTVASTDIQRRSGFRTGDLAVAAASDGSVCQLVEITDTSPGQVLGHATGNFTPFYADVTSPARFNGGAPVAFTGGNLFSLGPNPRQNTWTSSGGRLTRVDNIHEDTPAVIAEGVVSIKAQYGIDANNDNKIADTEWTTPTATPPDWTKVRAIRVAILVRSKQYERSVDPESGGQALGVTTAVPSWSGGVGVSGHPFVMTNVDGTPDSFGNNAADPNNWRFYRYRVYEKEIPLRNVIWATAPAS